MSSDFSLKYSSTGHVVCDITCDVSKYYVVTNPVRDLYPGGW